MSETFNILSIDPGTNMGVTIYTVSSLDMSIVKVETTVLDLNSRTVQNPMVDNLLIRLQLINNYLNYIMDTYNPIVLAMEAAFVNVRFPKSVIYLSQYISAISLTVTTKNPFIRLFNYAPKAVKSSIGAGGKADKDDITKALMNIPEITKHINVKYVSEHEADSLAIGYICLQELRNNPVLLLMI